MKQKIGIITIPDYNNYGNRLQNYAVKTVFTKLGFSVSTLEMNDTAFKSYKARKYKLLLKKYNVKPVVFLFNALKEGVLRAKRDAYFERFTRKYLETKYFPEYNRQTIERLNDTYDYFVFGSDQIWNPFINDTPNLYFGLFTDASKRIYYAPSFGVEQIDDAYAHTVAEALKNVEHISVREASGSKIIADLLDKKAEVLIDPTLMLDANEWEKIARKPNNFVQQKYMLSCFLGPKSKEYQTVIKNVMEETACETIYTIADRADKGYLTGPSEFVYSIKNAEFVITDSFHATVFAILFNKPFLVLSRLDSSGKNAKMDSRIDTLLARFNLQERKYAGKSVDYYTCDFSSVSSVLGKERMKVRQFIENCIGKNC